jgi:hypothetical protein
MPIGHLSRGSAASVRIAKKAERSRFKERVKVGKDFAFFIPFFLTEKKGAKKERPSVKR